MFEKRCSRIRLKLNLMDVIIIHEVEFKAYATALILYAFFSIGHGRPLLKTDYIYIYIEMFMIYV